MKRLLGLPAMLLTVALLLATLNSPSEAQVSALGADAVVLVNSTSADYLDFQRFIQPYLDNFGIPFVPLDISTTAVGADIGDYALIIVGHRQLDADDLYLDAAEEANIAAAVNSGTGLVNFDNDLTVGGTTPRYQFIQDIFGFGYSSPPSGSGVTFLSVADDGQVRVNCYEDAHQEPVLNTTTNPNDLSLIDGAWTELLYAPVRDYPTILAGHLEETLGLPVMHCFDSGVPNGEYEILANLYTSAAGRDMRYFYGFDPSEPKAYSVDTVGGAGGSDQHEEYSLGTITITDGNFDIYFVDGELLAGTYEYFGWAWIRLVPTAAPPPEMHWVTERHEAYESIGTGSMLMAGVIPPANVKTLAETGSQPFLAVTTYGQGHAVQWGTYDWMSHAVKGPIYGLDDLVWRGMVWAARKPFVMQGLPPFLTMRVDDDSGPFDWIHIANEFGLKPWSGLFFHNVDATEAADLSALVNSGNATTSIHAFNGGFFYYDHSGSDWPDATMAAHYAEGTQWHADHNIPISRFVLPHYYEIGTNAFQGLSDWGVEFIGTQMMVGQPYVASTPWLMNGPYRLYETGGTRDVDPMFYADFLTIPGHPEFEGQFFNCVTEIRDDAGYEWYPNTDVATSVGRGTRQSKRALDSMALATLFTHSQHVIPIPPDDWRAMLQGITDNLASYDPIYVTMDHACQYLRAMYTSDISASDYDPVTGDLTTDLTGDADMPTMFYLFYEQGDQIQQVLVDVPPFAVSTQVVYHLPGPLDHIEVIPNPATVVTNGNQQFSAQGYDADNNPIPNLSYTWDLVNGGGTIDSAGLFSAGATTGVFVDTVEASFNGITGAATVEIVEPTLDHFTFDTISSPQYVDVPVTITITARDSSGNPLLGYSGPAALSDTTGTIDPSITGSFSDGGWTGQASIGLPATGVTITVSDGPATGASNGFDVEPVPTYYAVTSTSYLQTESVPFTVTVTAREDRINCWEDDHQDPVLATFYDADQFVPDDDQWDEFKWSGRDYPAVFAGQTESPPLMKFYGMIPSGSYRLYANLYRSNDFRYYYGFDAGAPRAHTVEVTSGTIGDFTEFDLGIITVTNDYFELFTDLAEVIVDRGNFPFFGWAWLRFEPAMGDVQINAWEDDHQQPVLPTTTNVSDLVPDDGLWTEFHYVTGRPYPTILAGEDEINYGLPVMRIYDSGIPNGEYEIWANLYTSGIGRDMRYYYGFAMTNPSEYYVDTVGGAGGSDQHEEYSLGTITITDGNFDIYFVDGELLAGTYPYFGWAWIRLQPVLQLAMSSSSSTMLFDADGDGAFGEAGDDLSTLVNGTLELAAMDTTPSAGVLITATDAFNQSGYNTYRVRPTEAWVDDDFSAATVGWGVDHFASIQAALDVLAEGGLAHVAAGSYLESVVALSTIVTLTLEGDITLEGDLTLQAGTFNAPAGSFTLTGDLSQSGGTYNHNNGTLIFGGAGIQTIASPGLFLYNLTVSPGVELVGTGEISVGGAVTNQGIVSHQRDIAGAATHDFGLVGVSVGITDPTGLTHLRIERRDENHPNATTQLETGRYWTLTPNTGAAGFQVSLTLPHPWAPDELDKVCRYLGSGTLWDCAATSFDPSAGTITRDGVTEFSDWVTGDDTGPTSVTLRSVSATTDRHATPAAFLALIILAGLGISCLAARRWGGRTGSRV